jgi:hypothetical protein
VIYLWWFSLIGASLWSRNVVERDERVCIEDGQAAVRRLSHRYVAGF